MSLPAPPAWDEATDGRFPFGRPNTPRPVREPASGRLRQLVIGVYPSALHVAWTRPNSAGLPAGQRRVASMAVDVEPTVFWNGIDPDVDAEVQRWIDEVGFRAGDDAHGTIGSARNGPSGATLDEYFCGLPIDADDTGFLDVYPVYFVKRTPHLRKDGDRRQQGDAIDDVYNQAVPTLAVGPTGPWVRSNLPTRPTGVHGVVPGAVDRFGQWLIDVLLESDPEHVVTLGQEPWTALDRLPGVEVTHPGKALSRDPALYGMRGTIALQGRRIAWTPLAHPGLLHHGRIHQSGSWAQVHSNWQSKSRPVTPWC